MLTDDRVIDVNEAANYIAHVILSPVAETAARMVFAALKKKDVQTRCSKGLYTVAQENKPGNEHALNE